MVFQYRGCAAFISAAGKESIFHEDSALSHKTAWLFFVPAAMLIDDFDLSQVKGKVALIVLTVSAFFQLVPLKDKICPLVGVVVVTSKSESKVISPLTHFVPL